MTSEQIKDYVNSALQKNFPHHSSESGEMMTSADGDGHFFGKVTAVRYRGLPSEDLFLAIGQTEKKLQIVRLGKSECLRPSKDDLDGVLLKELGIKIES